MVRFSIRQPLVHQLSMQYLLVVPVLLSVAAVFLLAWHGDVNTPLLYSQCHSRSRLPEISRIPFLGAPACFLVSLFMFASASIRGITQLCVIVSFTSALLTVCRVEAARACNQRSWNIRFPTLSWLLFNLVGGTIVWDLWILPLFLRRAKDVRIERIKADALGGSGGGGGDDSMEALEGEERIMLERSLVTSAEVWAIPLAIAIGFVFPSAMMLALTNVKSVTVWLFFPVWVAVIHLAIKFVVVRISRDNGPIYLESHIASLMLVYALPFLASLFTHALFIWDLFWKDNSRELTRMALKIIGTDFIFIAATVLYWVLAESGITPAILLVVFTVFLGPGAALCLTWLIRERAICAFAVWDEQDVSDEDSDGDGSTVHEYTPLVN
ncbi:hypothetical protein GGR50DRAFT_94649 [Xylaria sp. CBS 124048]|nr:hypothetical protein GGR50DRAFT_94649 [Xylaria sp. CBS 124048]